VLIPPSGAIAGTYTSTDARRGVYKAPAGVDDGKLALAVGLERSINENQQSVLNPQGVNAIRDLPSFGICIWGARTASLDPAWMYISVRRTMIYLEQSVKNGTWWVVFEPNTSNLWAKVERNISVFLKQFWQAGGLFGLSEKEAFYVKCDASNNPPEQRELGYLVVEIGVSIVRPAEFVILQFTQMTQQS
jgi:phage tail sheath protein FI